jgi:intraflagellar transport protein 88
MALDIIPASSKEMRALILKNIGHSFVKLGRFHDAVAAYEGIMRAGADPATGFNLLLCLYALGDK